MSYTRNGVLRREAIQYTEASRSTTIPMQITVNGEARGSERALSISALLEEMGLGQRRVAVEVNEVIVPRSLHGQHMLAEGDRVEVVQAIGGG